MVTIIQSPMDPLLIKHRQKLKHQQYRCSDTAPDEASATVKPAWFTKPVMGSPSRAYVTFLAGAGDYVKGVVGLAKGLRKVKTVYPLVVAVIPDVPEEHRRILESFGCIVREVEPIYPSANPTQFAMAYYGINYSKLRIWKFVEYSKMVYLDGDIQVYDNIDSLFDLPDGHFYAVMDCLCQQPGYWKQCPEKVRWPAELGEPPTLYFNAGMFVFEPRQSIYEDILRTLKVTPPTPYAEQDFLNMYFRDDHKPIPAIYNLLVHMLWRHAEEVDLDNVKVVHFCASGSKPWRYDGRGDNMQREDIKMLVNKWWDIYNDESLDYRKCKLAADGDPEPAKIKQNSVHYMIGPSAA